MSSLGHPLLATLACCLAGIAPLALHAQDPSRTEPADGPEPERSAIHWQATNVTQGHPRFHAPYSGDNSLQPDGRT